MLKFFMGTYSTRPFTKCVKLGFLIFQQALDLLSESLFRIPLSRGSNSVSVFTGFKIGGWWANFSFWSQELCLEPKDVCTKH